MSFADNFSENTEDGELVRRLNDLVAQSERTGSPRFTLVLTEHEQAVASSVIRGELYGGYDEAERKMLRIGDFGEFPLCAFTASFRECDELSHRDFLGSLMGLGIKRELVGDIIVSKGFAVFFTAQNVKELVLSELSKVGRTGVKLTEGITHPIPEREFEIMSVVVASMRLDAIVAAITNLSREKSLRLIKSGLVVCNGRCLTDGAVQINENARLSVRGYGKYIVSQNCGQTRKGKIHLEIKKYI